jgi:hypothetical protein
VDWVLQSEAFKCDGKASLYQITLNGDYGQIDREALREEDSYPPITNPGEFLIKLLVARFSDEAPDHPSGPEKLTLWIAMPLSERQCYEGTLLKDIARHEKKKQPPRALPVRNCLACEKDALRRQCPFCRVAWFCTHQYELAAWTGHRTACLAYCNFLQRQGHIS